VEGADPRDPDACGFDAQGPDATVSDVGGPGDADAGADVEAGSADADADAEAEAEAEAEADTDEEAGTYPPPASSTDGMLWPTPFPELPSWASLKPSGATGPPPSRPPSVEVTVPTAFDPSRAPVRSQPNAPSSAISAASATSPIVTGLLLLGALSEESGWAFPSVLTNSRAASGYRVAPAKKAGGSPARALRRSSASSKALPHRSSGSLAKSPITSASIASGR
jgi:hypothetical protein